MTEAARIQDTRLRLKLTQVQLAELVGVHPMTVSKWERGVLRPSGFCVALLESFRQAVYRQPNVGWWVRPRLRAVGVSWALYTLLRCAFDEDPKPWKGHPPP